MSFRIGATGLITLLLSSAVACGDSTGEGGGGTTTTTQTGASTSATKATSAATSTKSASSSVANTGSSATGAMFDCNPAAPPDSFYARTAESYDINIIDPVPMCKYRGDVVLVVNTAALCGFTPQYKGLEVLEKHFKPQGFHVVGFISDDFDQAGSTGQIDACVDEYQLTIEQFAIDHVVDAPVQPVWDWILSQPNPGPAPSIEPQWNFHKYLISRDGRLVKHYTNSNADGYWPEDVNDPAFATNAIIQAIEAELAASP